MKYIKKPFIIKDYECGIDFEVIEHKYDGNVEYMIDLDNEEIISILKQYMLLKHKINISTSKTYGNNLITLYIKGEHNE